MFNKRLSLEKRLSMDKPYSFKKRVSLDSTLGQFIIEVREQFLRERYSVNPTNYDPIDIERVKTQDYTIKRFLVSQNMKKELALNQLDEAMKWRKSFGVNQLDYSDMAVEMFEIGSSFIYNEDKEERPVLYMRAKTYFKITQIDHILKKNMILMLNKLDELADEKGFTIFLDGSDAGLKNFDLMSVQFMMNIVTNFFPGAVKCVLWYNYPLILSKVISICKHIVGPKYSKIFQVINKKEEIFHYIDSEKVPKYLGGKCEKDFTKPPPNCTLNIKELAVKLSIDVEDMQKFLKLFEPHINEAKLLVCV